MSELHTVLLILMNLPATNLFCLIQHVALPLKKVCTQCFAIVNVQKICVCVCCQLKINVLDTGSKGNNEYQ